MDLQPAYQAALEHTETGKEYLSQHQYRKALPHYQQARDIFQSLQKHRHTERARLHLAVCWMMTGRVQDALDILRAVDQASRELEDKALEGAAAGNLGLAYQNLKDYTNSIEQQKRALEIGRALQDQAMQLQAQIHLAECYLQEGRCRQAQGFGLVAQDLARQLGDLSSLGIIKDLLGRISACGGDLRGAVNYHQEAIEIASKLGDLPHQAAALANLALAKEGLTELKEAADALDQAISLFQLTDSRSLDRALKNRARIKRALANG